MLRANIYLFTLLVFFSLCSSCIQQIELTDENSSQRLVVNALITPDSAFTITVTTTRSVFDTNIYFINNAAALLYENAVLIDTLEPYGNGRYGSPGYFPVAGNNYGLVVNADAYESIITGDVVPDKTSLLSAVYTKDHLFDKYGDTYLEYNFLIADDPAVNNYYDIILFEKYYDPVFDITYINYPFWPVDPNSILINEGDQDYQPRTMFFSDELFNGDTLDFYTKFENGVYGSSFPGNYLPAIGNGFYAELRSVSENYYNYRKWWTRHSFSQPTGGYTEDPLQLIFITEPVEMFTNIENGYGIFAAYQSDIKELVFIP